MSSLYISHELSAISFQPAAQTEGWELVADRQCSSAGLLIRHHASSYLIDCKTFISIIL